MFFISLFRVIKFSLQDVTRNIWLSLVTIIILVLALFSINMILVVKVIGQTTIGAIKDRIDINLYLSPEASEEDILELKGRLSNLSEIKKVKYVSKIDALKSFSKKNKDNPEVLQALRELGKNPLTPTLVIEPSNIDNLDALINELNKIESDIIDSRNFADHKTVLEKINNVTDKASKVGIIIAMVFIFTTLLVIYNSIRVAIYTHNREIAIMRLVGASNIFIYMPFIFSGLIYALFGVAVIVAVFYPFLTLLQPYLTAFFIGYGVDIVGYFDSNLIVIFGLQLLGVAIVNTIASFIAVKKYSQG